MTTDEHQRERMRAWVTVFAATIPTACGAHVTADGMLDSFDKRFPAPSAAAPVEPDAPSTFAYDVKVIDVETYKADMAELETLRRTQAMHDAELASLRQKARLWDAVASGKVRISVAGRAYCTWNLGNEMTSLCDTAEEAVEAAIAAGATK